MMGSHKKKIKIAVAEADEKFDESVGELAEAFIEELKEHHRSTLEPFEHYAEKIRVKVHSDVHTFRSRFLKGYHTLLEELAKELPKN